VLEIQARPQSERTTTDLGVGIMPKSKIVLTAAILLLANLAAVAQDARFPNLDVPKALSQSCQVDRGNDGR
jgi:hypothetical protein